MQMLFKTPAQERFEQAKYGMFIHWGLYALIGRGEWAKLVENIPHEEYRKLQPQFNPTQYDPEAWAQLMQDSGIHYVVITARHHDGFSMFDTAQSDWSVMNTPYGRDALAPLVEACRKRGILFFFYYSMLDWTREDYKKDFHHYLGFMNQQLAELCTNYGKIDGIWFDGVNFLSQWHSWDVDTLIRTIKIRQPEALVCVNQAFLSEGSRTTIHGDIDFITYEKHGIRPFYQAGPKYVAHEMCTTIGVDAWGYHKTEAVISPREALEFLLSTVCRGGNLLLNTGPDELGRIPEIHQQCYQYVGEWLRAHGSAVYDTRPAGLGLADWGGCVAKGDSLYCHVWSMPESRKLQIEAPARAVAGVRLQAPMKGAAGKSQSVPFTADLNTVTIDLSGVATDEPASVLELELTGSERWMKIECEDYLPGGEGVGYHVGTTWTPLPECYRKDDVGCQEIEGEPLGVAVRTRKGTSLIYNVNIPRSGRVEVLLRARDIVDTQIQNQPLRVAMERNARPWLAPSDPALSAETFQIFSLGEAELEAGEQYLALNVLRGLAHLDWIKLVWK